MKSRWKYCAIAAVAVMGAVIFANVRFISSTFSYYELSCWKGNDFYPHKFSDRASADAATRQQQLLGLRCSTAKRTTFLIP